MSRYPKVGEWGSIEYAESLGGDLFPHNQELHLK